MQYTNLSIGDVFYYPINIEYKPMQIWTITGAEFKRNIHTFKVMSEDSPPDTRFFMNREGWESMVHGRSIVTRNELVKLYSEEAVFQALLSGDMSVLIGQYDEDNSHDDN